MNNEKTTCIHCTETYDVEEIHCCKYDRDGNLKITQEDFESFIKVEKNMKDILMSRIRFLMRDYSDLLDATYKIGDSENIFNIDFDKDKINIRYERNNCGDLDWLILPSYFLYDEHWESKFLTEKKEEKRIKKEKAKREKKAEEEERTLELRRKEYEKLKKIFG